MRASSGSRPRMKLTTQPSQAPVSRAVHSSQLIVIVLMWIMLAARCDNYVWAMVHAFVLIDGVPSRVADLATELAEIDGVSEVYSVAGEADIVAVVRVRHHEELADVVTRRISQLDGVEVTRTLIAFQAYSRHDLDAIWDLGAD